MLAVADQRVTLTGSLLTLERMACWCFQKSDDEEEEGEASEEYAPSGEDDDDDDDDSDSDDDSDASLEEEVSAPLQSCFHICVPRIGTIINLHALEPVSGKARLFASASHRRTTMRSLTRTRARARTGTS